MRRATLAALVAVVVLASGCSQLTLMSDGHLGLDLGGPGSDALLTGDVSHAAPVLEAFDAQQSAGDDGTDPNSRAGANCSGGVCAIF